MLVILSDFKNPDLLYCFNPETHEVSKTTDTFDKNAAGFGSEVKTGFFLKKKIFVAVYPDNDALVLWIDGQQFNLRAETLKVKRRWIPFSFTYYFLVKNPSRELLGFWYTHVSFESWPDNGDIIAHICDIIASSCESIEQTFFIMKAKLEGRNFSDPHLQEEMDEFVKKNLGN